jgi:hypothetical protein
LSFQAAKNARASDVFIMRECVQIRHNGFKQTFVLLLLVIGLMPILHPETLIQRLRARVIDAR